MTNPETISGREKINVLLISREGPELLERIRPEFHGESDPFFDFQLILSDSLQDGLQKVKSDPINTVLFDFGSNEKEGLEAYQYFQALPLSMPVVLLISGGNESLACEAVHKGAQDFLIKEKMHAGVIPHVLRSAIDRKRLEERLVQSQKMEVLGRLVSAVSHDLRNLIMVIMGYADLAKENIHDSAALSGNIQEIAKASLSANTLINRLLSFSRQQATAAQVIDLNVVIKNMEGLLRRLMGSSVQMNVELAEGNCFVSADPSQIEQILMNLIANARDAMEGGGSFTIKTSKKNTAPSPRNPAKKGVVLLSVKDSGAGMDAETQKKIFEPFFTTKRKHKGTGLGLSTVSEIVKQVGGTIEVYSQPGTGTIFKIYFPEAAEPVKDAAAPLPAEVPPLARGTETILVAEDEAPVRNLIKTLLKKNGYEVLAAEHGAEAIEMANTFKGEIHLLLTDSMMPCMSGDDLKKALMAIRPGMKVLMMTGYLSHQKRLQEPSGSPETFLQKPFSEYELITAVRQILDSSS